jgi:hypothetical protein
MYVDGDDNDSLMEIDDPGSEFEEDGTKKKKVTRKPREIESSGLSANNKRGKWQKVCDEDGIDIDEKKKMR